TGFNSGPGGGSDSKGGEHFAPADASWTSPSGVKYFGADDLMTPYYTSSQRRIISIADAFVRRDAYGYSVKNPALALGTFYSGRNDAAAVAIDSTKTVYALNVNDHGVYRYDGGSSWTNVAPAKDVQSLAADKHGTLYA